MKKMILMAFLLLSIAAAGQQSTKQDTLNVFPKPKVDRRVELMSIVFRLAGNEEYSGEYFKNYIRDIHNHFDTLKNHPLIAFATKLREENGVSYDAVMKMAFHIGQPPLFIPQVNFDDAVPEQRWGKENAMKFIELLRDFYTVSHFEEFYTAHAALYTLAEERFLPIYKSLNIDWYNQYYGTTPNGTFNVLICMGNGGGNYGGKIVFPDGREDAYAVMGTWSVDSTGNPVYRKQSYFPILVHEFNHSYVNPIIDKNKQQLESSGKIMFEPVERKMKRIAYGSWQTMMYESLVRASVIRYLIKYDTYSNARSQLIDEVGNGFYWMQGLTNLLSEYEHRRDKYPTLESFMPKVAQFYDKYAKQSPKMYELKR
ncbi:DUF4932 domain-containing protein [Alistipes sp. ZOR0009]|uniref:DUF4932 domain-containing protein n=1 Tax=Alistipes sp. ZOR0009 TaxID=1339253 RepID=UPI0006461662|nr:DUF4932 domain-containing protein [Alistipes sp. ZOR0009]